MADTVTSPLERTRSIPATGPLVFALAAIAALWAALNLAGILVNLRLASFDDELVFRGLHDATAYANNVELDLSLGRFYGAWKFWFLSQVLAIADPWLLASLRVALMLVPVAACAWFFAVILKCREAGLLVALLWLATTPIFAGYQPALSNPLLLLGLALIFLAGACVVHVARGHWTSRAGGAAVAFYSAALLTHENFIVFLAVVVWARLAAIETRGTVTQWLEFLAPYLVVTGTYIAIYVLLKRYAATLEVSYDGTRPRFDLFAIGNALVRYTGSAFPGFGVVFDPSAAASGSPIYAPAEIVARLRLNLRWQDAAAGLTLAAAFAALVQRMRTLRPARLTLALWSSAIGIIFIPNLLIALTSKYQHWALLRRYPYYYGGLGMPFFWLLGGLAFWTLLHAAHKRNALLASVVTGAGALAFAALYSATAAMNREAVGKMLLQPFR